MMYLLLLILLGEMNYRKKIDDVMGGVLANYANVAMEQAVSEIRKIGGKVTKAQRKIITEEYISKRMDFLNKELNRVTEEKLGDMFMQAQTIDEIRKGLESNYALSKNRSKIIANTEFHELQNTVVVEIASKVDEVVAMYITDGVNYDSACATANGSLWSVEYAKEHPLEHPQCQRLLHPVGKDFVEEWGGLDEE